MKKLFAIAVLMTLLPLSALAKGGKTHVDGYITKSGKYVAPHERTAPNKNKSDNWSTKGNVNPTTGKSGTVDPNKTKKKP